MHVTLLAAVVGYLLGSVPFGYLLVRTFLRADVRTTGSGNIGATNVARSSPKLGIVTLLLDMLKGLAAVGIAFAVSPGNRMVAFVAAFAAICGHVFPVWLRFRGGKGVATGLGSFILLAPKSILLTMAVFVLLVIAFRYISVASIIAAAFLPMFAFFIKESRSPAEFVFVFAGSLLIVLKHHRNIRRLMSGTEPKFELKRQ